MELSRTCQKVHFQADDWPYTDFVYLIDENLLFLVFETGALEIV
jgi:hypothetical protein